MIKAQREKAKTLVDLAKVCEFYYRDPQAYDEKAAKKAFNAEAVVALAKLREALAVMDEWSREAIHAALQQVVDQLGVGFGKVGMPARLAITAGAPSPDLDLVIQLVGREAALRRFDKAIEFINTSI